MALVRDTAKKSRKSRFVKDDRFRAYKQPKMISQAQDLLARDEQSEEGFLGAQAVLLINGLL